MMRFAVILLGSTLVVTGIRAQTPLTVDTNFQFYYTPELMDHWQAIYAQGGNWQPAVIDIVLRNDGNVLATGPELSALEVIPWGDNRSVIMDQEGGVVEFLPSCGGRITELPSLNQYYCAGRVRHYDCTSDQSYGWPDFQFNGVSFWLPFDDRTALSAGEFRITSDDSLRYVLVKLDEWGEWDSTFTPRAATGGNLFGRALYPLANDQYLFNGRWATYEGRPCTSVIRIGPDGVQDTTFNFPSPYCNLSAIHEQEDGKVILAGQFLMQDYADTLNLLRVNVDGSLDLTFNNFNHVVLATDSFSTVQYAGITVLEPLDEGRFVIGGVFTRIDEAHRGCIAVVDSSGNLLDTWANGGLVPSDHSPYGTPYVGLGGFKKLANGESYIFGQYQGFIDENGLHPEQCLMSRLFMPTVGIDDDSGLAAKIDVWPNPGYDQLNLSWVFPGSVSVLVSDLQGRTVEQRTVCGASVSIDMSKYSSGLYNVVFIDKNGVRAITNWIKQ